MYTINAVLKQVIYTQKNLLIFQNYNLKSNFLDRNLRQKNKNEIHDVGIFYLENFYSIRIKEEIKI